MEEQQNEIQNIFKTVRQAEPERPWAEFVCNEAQMLFVDEFFNSIDNIPRLQEENQPMIFRGQKDSNWTLMPKLYRLWNHKVKIDEANYENVLKTALNSEYDAIRHFQQKAHLFLKPARILERNITWSNIGDWIALMQHYNAPTRFLDWTSSFHVALYFAVEDDKMDGAVWVLHATEHVACMDKLFKRPDVATGNTAVSSYKSFLDFGLKAEPRIEALSTELHTERIVNQRGVFTFSYNLFNDHVSAGFYHLQQERKPFLYKIVIPANMKKEIRKKLAKINICSETLFPGIDGLGKSIYEKLELLMEVYFPQ